MIVATAFVLFQVLAYDKSPSQTRTLGSTLWTCVVAFCAIHCIIVDLTIHSIVFVGMILACAWRTSSLISMIKDARRRRRAKYLVRLGASKVEPGNIRSSELIAP